MRFLFVHYYYQDYLDSFSAQHPGFGELSYHEALQAFFDEAADVADAYSSNLKKLGHDAVDVVVNDEILQKLWASENGIRTFKREDHQSKSYRSVKRLGRQILKRTGSAGQKLLAMARGPIRKAVDPWMYEILNAQVRKFRPDVLFTFNIAEFDTRFFHQVRPFVKLIVGQHASPLPPTVPYGCYDLMLSSLPHYVDFFRGQGIKSEYFRLGFNASVLQRVQTIPNAPTVVHVGSYGPVHTERNELLEHVASQVRVDFWGVGIENLSKNSPILQNYHGEAWGMKRNDIFHSSRIALTKHITSVAGAYANNLTLYEATGVGTLLVTDLKHNLNDLFEVGKEVVAYESAQECADLVKYYLDHEDERAAIAHAGQRRTRRDHTFYRRMQELVDITKRCMP